MVVRKMANPLTKMIMNNIVKQSPYKIDEKKYQKNTGNLNSNEELLLVNIINKNNTSNSSNTSNTSISNNTNNTNNTKSIDQKSVVQNNKQIMSLDELVKKCSKDIKKYQEEQTNSKVISSSKNYMDLNSYVPKVTLNSIGKKND